MGIFCMTFHGHGSWRKASKCKKLIKQVQIRLKVLQARKNAIILQTQEDIAKLLQRGYFQRAFYLVENLYKDKCRASAYELINEICECISNNLSCIANKSDITMELNIAISSLTFAAARCGELPDLNKLRTLFRDCFGIDFDTKNVNLLPTNLVKSELKNTLSPTLISEDIKLELIQEITKKYSVNTFPPENSQHVSSENGYCTSETVVQSVSLKGVKNKRTPFCCDTESFQPFNQELAKKKEKDNGFRREGEMSKRTRLLTGLLEGEGRDENENENENEWKLSHVHPKLPYYEDLEAKFKIERCRECVRE